MSRIIDTSGRAAETYAEEIQHAKYFDPKNDTVLVAGVQSHKDLQKVLDAANAEDRPGGYGKVESVALFAHAGGDGPVFHDVSGHHYQLTSSDISAFSVHWSGSSTASFFGCNTAHKSFTQEFANAQGVPTYYSFVA